MRRMNKLVLGLLLFGFAAGCGNRGGQVSAPGGAAPAPARVAVTALSTDAQVMIQLATGLKDEISALPAASFKTSSAQASLIQKLNSAIQFFTDNKMDQGMQQFVSVNNHLDGCMATPPAPDADDWILDCALSNTVATDITQMGCINTGGGIASIAISAAKTTLNAASDPAEQFSAVATLNASGGAGCPSGGTLDVTGSAAWTSSAPAAGTISASGLFQPVAPGTTDVSASLGPITSNAVTVTVFIPACTVDADCADLNALTLDSCTDGGTINAACQNIPIACNADTDCNDGNALTIDACQNGGTILSMCQHTAIACITDADCDDSNANTTDTCNNPGQANASCSNVARLNIATDVSAGAWHTCAVLSGGGVQCWGYGPIGSNEYRPNAYTPVNVTGITNAVAVSSGHDHTCALLSSGGIRCWGQNSSGELGNGTTMSSVTPVAVLGINDAVAVSAGFNHTCAVLAGGGVRCWGFNGEGQIGNGTRTGNFLTPEAVVGINDAVAVSAGYYFSCAVLAGGGVRCWGFNQSGQLGNGTTIGSTTPVVVSGITNAVGVSATAGTSKEYACAVLSDGGIRCWGYNWSGSLGNETTIFSKTPLSVTGISNGINVSAGWAHTCAALSSGGVKCWGYNRDGELGNGTTTFSMTPVSVIGLTNAVKVSSGSAGHSCAVLSNGGIRCWGYNFYGQLGYDNSTRYSSTPVSVVGFP